MVGFGLDFDSTNDKGQRARDSLSIYKLHAAKNATKTTRISNAMMITDSFNIPAPCVIIQGAHRCAPTKNGRKGQAVISPVRRTRILLYHQSKTKRTSNGKLTFPAAGSFITNHCIPSIGLTIRSPGIFISQGRIACARFSMPPIKSDRY